jgi:hypothetical protein
MGKNDLKTAIDRAIRDFSNWDDFDELSAKERVLTDIAKSGASHGEEARQEIIGAIITTVQSVSLDHFGTGVCFKVLVKLGDYSPKVVDFLGSFIDGEINRSDKAIDSLSEMAETSDVALDKLVYWSSHPEVEQRIGYALKKIKREAPSIVSAFVKALDSGNEYVRNTALEFFTENPKYAKKAKKKFLELLKDGTSRNQAKKILQSIGIDLKSIEPSKKLNFLRSYLFMWLYTGTYIRVERRLFFWPIRIVIGISLWTLGAYIGNLLGGYWLGNGLGFGLAFIWWSFTWEWIHPVRIIIGIGLSVLSIYVGNLFGYPRLGLGLGLGLAFICISPASDWFRWRMFMIGLVLTLAWIFWKIYSEVTSTSLTLLDLILPFATFLILLDALKAYDKTRFKLYVNSIFCPVCGRALRTVDVGQVFDKDLGGGRVKRVRSYVAQKICKCGYRRTLG